ncbi:type IV secretion system DNA-binding domain-containing protein [Aeromonas hydrophila]|uniref:Type IV secretion system DNA-binding domain-containing protein n=1 Tax=Aeromonas hydrophila TaxID=644 RepID=A0A926FI75_AERHY|nr:type IV secretion system DNA-binding domain-containing protein [Aeromonas hydrophila]
MVISNIEGDIHTTVKPLFTAMIEVVIKACMMLNQDRNRRIFIILDEVQSLNFIPAFTDGLAELRQFGIVFVISYQLQAQLRTIYRETGATTISGLLGTRVAYQTPDEQTASWLSKNFSETEVKEMETTKSFGGHH